MCFHTKTKYTFDSINPMYKPPECAICLDPIWSHAHWCPHCKQPHHTQCLRKWKKNCPLCRGRLRL